VFLKTPRKRPESLSSPEPLLINTSERKRREAGALEGENGNAGNDGKKEKAL